MTNQQQMTAQMEAELIFDGPASRDRAVEELTRQGFAVELLDWVDEFEGEILTATVWIKVTGAYAGSDIEFFAEMTHLAEQFSGDVVEAGFANPPH
jgi:hypothetical protein